MAVRALLRGVRAGAVASREPLAVTPATPIAKAIATMARFDFLNEFGRHCLDLDDGAWADETFQQQVLRHCSGRDVDRLGMRAGPLDPQLLSPHLEQLLGPGWVLRSVTGSPSHSHQVGASPWPYGHERGHR